MLNYLIFFFDLETNMVKHGNATIDVTYFGYIKAHGRIWCYNCKKDEMYFLVNLEGTWLVASHRILSLMLSSSRFSVNDPWFINFLGVELALLQRSWDFGNSSLVWKWKAHFDIRFLLGRKGCSCIINKHENH